ncbi:G protein-regulated inducer of neurite outgrowth 1 [Periophthalmus magnuspinnatus]|uniref:G protein-regulated inducer of neurite outgrowth 1 n=1 Tax=Periophthalmus magnuspinnatus TaxID=409849 RepID=UPI002436E076|nr:G protein-regulated inducer of neurite outgrowth 1 [Periophthalmus magnuspinnatus]
MGTLKDDMRGVSNDRLLSEKAEDGEYPGSSDGTALTDASQSSTGVESTRAENEPKPEYNNGETLVKTDGAVNVEMQSISVAVPSTPDPTDPRSPAPFGQAHMRTQVSLEVVQCHSAATSPMTPPEGGHNSSFFFPSSFGKSEAVGTDTKDAELQVGKQVEYSSVATSPMTPKTPFFSTFSSLQSRESAQKESKDSQGCQIGAINPSEPEISGALKLSSSKELESEDLGCGGAPVSSANCPAGTVMNSEGKQQRMGSMDQDITILVTQHGNAEEDENKTDSSVPDPTDTEVVKLVGEEEKQTQDETADQEASAKTQEDPAKTELKSCRSLEAQDSKDVVPESPAPFGCHNMRTQVSLEVVQCQSAATSPMTPPEGDQAFSFPAVSSRCGGVGTDTRDAEMQVGQQVEYRSVATAPMTPRTPTATTFPEIIKRPSIDQKIVEEEEEKDAPKEKDGDDQEEKESEESEGSEGGDRGEGSEGGDQGEGSEGGDQGDGSEGGDQGEGSEESEGSGRSAGSDGSEGGEENQTAEDSKEEVNDKEDKCEEPVQEVSWDEKGMTWEVYGAVVEVSVLGSAIQKHLDKQVKKQKKQTLPPPPPLNPSATPVVPSEASPRATGSGKGRGKRAEKTNRRRRNPFRQMMENIQQPHCCSRAHTTE